MEILRQYTIVIKEIIIIRDAEFQKTHKFAYKLICLNI